MGQGAKPFTSMSGLSEGLAPMDRKPPSLSCALPIHPRRAGRVARRQPDRVGYLKRPGRNTLGGAFSQGCLEEEGTGVLMFHGDEGKKKPGRGSVLPMDESAKRSWIQRRMIELHKERHEDCGVVDDTNWALCYRDAEKEWNEKHGKENEQEVD